jgi:hypothetical protein
MNGQGEGTSNTGDRNDNGDGKKKPPTPTEAGEALDVLVRFIKNSLRNGGPR